MANSNAAPDTELRTDSESTTTSATESKSENENKNTSDSDSDSESTSTDAGVGDQFDRQALKWDFDIPDATTIHETSATDESSAPNESSGAQKHPHKDIAYYACPFCGFTDPTERVVRAHITKADDIAHENRNAFVDRMFVQAMADDDTIVEDVAPPAEGGTRYTGDDSVTFIPGGVDPDTQSRTAEILDAAVKTPMASQADLSEAIYGDRTRGASQISTAITRYLGTDRDGNRQDGAGTGEDGSERNSNSDADTTASATGATRDRRLEAIEFYERTEKQRRVILAWLDDPDPDRTRAEIAAAASVSDTYVPVVRGDYEWLIDQLQAELEAGSMTFEKIVACAELTQPEKLTFSSIDGDDDGDGESDGNDSDRAAEGPHRAIEAFEEATGKQQAVMLAWLADPASERSLASVYQMAGVSQGYGGRVLSQYDETVTALEVLIQEQEGELTLAGLSERAAITHETALDEAGLSTVRPTAGTETGPAVELDAGLQPEPESATATTPTTTAETESGLESRLKTNTGEPIESDSAVALSLSHDAVFAIIASDAPTDVRRQLYDRAINS